MAAAEDDFDAKVRAYILDNPEVILEALTILSDRERAAEMSARIADFPQLFDDPPIHGIGDPDAPIRVIKFFDYRCVPCKAIHPALLALTDKEPALRIEMRHLPILSPGSERAARFALAVRQVAGNGAYERVHDRLWTVRGPLNAVTFERIALEEGLDFQPIADRMDDAEITDRITYNRDAAIALEILGTPAFVTPNTVSFGQSDVGALAETWLNQ